MTSGREQLLDAAERLFGELGIDAVSLRQIGLAAGQRNTAAAHYHFGSKEALVGAVFDRRMAPVNEARHRMLAELDAEGRGEDPAALVAAFVLPFAAAIGPGTSYARFSAQVLAGPTTSGLHRLDRPVMSSLRLVFERLDAALEPDPLRGERLRLLGLLVVHALADRERALADDRPALPPAADAQRALLDAATAIITVPARANQEPQPC